jgi:hypothetical protein
MGNIEDFTHFSLASLTLQVHSTGPPRCVNDTQAHCDPYYVVSLSAEKICSYGRSTPPLIATITRFFSFFSCSDI